MTLENVLEQTIVHEVDVGGAASSAGVVAGVLVCGVGDEMTSGLLHEEVIALLRKPCRPLVVRLRDVDRSLLEKRRAESRRVTAWIDTGEDSTDAEAVRSAPIVALALHALRAAEMAPATAFAAFAELEEPSLGERRPVADEADETAWAVEEAAEPSSEDAARRCELALAALDDALSAQSEAGEACRQAVALSVDHTAFARALCACVEYVPPVAQASSDDSDKRLASKAKAASSAARLAQGPSAPARVDDDDGDLAELVAAYAGDCAVLDGNEARDAACRWAAAASLVGSELSSFRARAARLLARLAFAQRGVSKRAATSTLPACMRLYRASKNMSLNSLPSRACADTRTEVGSAAAHACCSIGPACFAALPRRMRPLVRHALVKIARESAHATARAAAARSLGALGALDPTLREAAWLVRVCDRLSRDALPCVRRGALDAVLALAAALPDALVLASSDCNTTLSRAEEVHLLHCKLMPLATSLAEDSSPEVRAAVARRAGALCDAFGEKRTAVVVDDARGLLEDTDARVRCAAAKALPDVAAVAARFVGSRGQPDHAALGLLAPAATRLASDSNAEARAALAIAVGGFLAIACDNAMRANPPPKQPLTMQGNNNAGGADDAVIFDRAVFPLALILVNDEEPTVACAALDALAALADDWDDGARAESGRARRRYRHLATFDHASVWHVPPASRDEPNSQRKPQRQQDAYVRVAGLTLLLADHHVSKLVLSLQDLATSRHWRVRARAATCVPTLVPCCSTASLAALRRSLAVLCGQLCSDVVDEVRRAASRALCRSAIVDEAVAARRCRQPSHGADPPRWLITAAIPELERLVQSAKHKDRKLAVVCSRDLLSVAHLLEDDAYPALEAVARVALVLAADDQPLVRLGAAKLLAILPSPFLHDAKACAATLADDLDPDVGGFAKREPVASVAGPLTCPFIGSLAILTSRIAPSVDPDPEIVDASSLHQVEDPLPPALLGDDDEADHEGVVGDRLAAMRV